VSNRKAAGAISSAEVRDCILRMMSDPVMGGLYAQHTIWQAMDDHTLIREPVAFYQAARDPDNWKRKSRAQHHQAGIGLGWRRIYVCRPLEKLKPRFEVWIDTDNDEGKVNSVQLVWWPQGAPDHNPSKKPIPVVDAFPNRVPLK